MYRTLEEAQRVTPELDGVQVDRCILHVWLAVHPPGTTKKQLRRLVRCGLNLAFSPGGSRQAASGLHMVVTHTRHCGLRKPCCRGPTVV